jgi:hypothetical protein
MDEIRGEVPATDVAAPTSDAHWNELLAAAWDEFTRSSDPDRARILGVLRAITEVSRSDLRGDDLLALLDRTAALVWYGSDDLNVAADPGSLCCFWTKIQALFARAVVAKWNDAGRPLPSEWSKRRRSALYSSMPDVDEEWNWWNERYGDDPLLNGDPDDPMNHETPFVREWFAWIRDGCTPPRFPEEDRRWLREELAALMPEPRFRLLPRCLRLRAPALGPTRAPRRAARAATSRGSPVGGGADDDPSEAGRSARRRT